MNWATINKAPRRPRISIAIAELIATDKGQLMIENPISCIGLDTEKELPVVMAEEGFTRWNLSSKPVNLRDYLHEVLPRYWRHENGDLVITFDAWLDLNEREWSVFEKFAQMARKSPTFRDSAQLNKALFELVGQAKAEEKAALN